MLTLSELRILDSEPGHVLIDFSGGLFHVAYSTAPAEVMAIDSEDPENPRAHVPGIEVKQPIWVGVETANEEPEFVNSAFEKTPWLDGCGPGCE